MTDSLRWTEWSPGIDKEQYNGRPNGKTYESLNAKSARKCEGWQVSLPQSVHQSRRTDVDVNALDNRKGDVEPNPPPPSPHGCDPKQREPCYGSVAKHGIKQRRNQVSPPVQKRAQQ